MVRGSLRTHLDHSPACRSVQAATGAATYGFGRHGSGRIDAGVQVEEGADKDIVPDVLLSHGDIVRGDGWPYALSYLQPILSPAPVFGGRRLTA
jgi:hypothetical protein